MRKHSLLVKVYLSHPAVVGLPTTKRDLYNPPPLSKEQVPEFCKKWGVPVTRVPKEWGAGISPILVAMHLEIEGKQVKSTHTNTIAQYLLWKGGDKILMYHIHIARRLPPVIPKRTFYWYLCRYNLQIKDVRGLGMLYPNAREEFVWTIKEVRDSLIEIDTLVLEWYRLAYLMARETGG